MRNPSTLLLAVSVALVALTGGQVRAGGSEAATVETAAGVLHDLAASPWPCIPTALLQDSHAVAIIPNVLKAGFVVGGRHGKGVVLLREPDGHWSPPIFVTLSGGSIGWQIGVQSTDVVLVFKTRGGLDRLMRGKGKLTLGADASVAAGPLGRQFEAGTDAQLKAEIYSYSRSRGLFAGLSIEGAGLLIDHDADAAFYRVPWVSTADILSGRVAVPLPAAQVQGELTRLTVPPPPVIVAPPVPVPVAPPPPPAPVPPPPPR